MNYIFAILVGLVIGFGASYCFKREESDQFEAQFNDYVDERMERLRKKFDAFLTPPAVALIQIGNDENDTEYCYKFIDRCRDVGVNIHWYGFDSEQPDWELLSEIKDLGEHYNGLVVKLSHSATVTGVQAHAAIPTGKNIIGLARATGIMNFLEEVGCNLKNITIYSNQSDLYRPQAEMAIEKYNDVSVQILPESQSTTGRKGFTKEHLDTLGFVEAMENLLHEYNSVL